MEDKNPEFDKGAGDAPVFGKESGCENSMNDSGQCSFNVTESVVEEISEDEPKQKKIRFADSKGESSFGKCIRFSPFNPEISNEIIILERPPAQRTKDDSAVTNSSRGKTIGIVKRRCNIHANAEVQEIVAIQTLKNGGRNLLVRWKHLSDEYNTWMEEEKLLNETSYKLFMQQEKAADEERKEKVKQVLRSKR